MPKRAVFERSRRELSLDVSIGVHVLLVVEQSGLESQSWGCAKTPILTVYRPIGGWSLNSEMSPLYRVEAVTNGFVTAKVGPSAIHAIAISGPRLYTDYSNVWLDLELTVLLRVVCLCGENLVHQYSCFY